MTSNIEDSKDQLLALANHYNVGLSVADKRLKGSLKLILISALVEQNVLQAEQTRSTVQASRMSLSYEQQKDLLLIETQSKEKIEQQKIEEMKLKLKRGK